MEEFKNIFAVAAILWTAVILYAAYLDTRLRKLEEKIK
jgi:CcmD family protein